MRQSYVCLVAIGPVLITVFCTMQLLEIFQVPPNEMMVYHQVPPDEMMVCLRVKLPLPLLTDFIHRYNCTPAS